MSMPTSEKAKMLMEENEKRAKLVITSGMKLGNSLLMKALGQGTPDQKMNQLGMLRVMAVEILASNVFNALLQNKVTEEELSNLYAESRDEIAERVEGMRKDYASGKTIAVNSNEKPEKKPVRKSKAAPKDTKKAKAKKKAKLKVVK